MTYLQIREYERRTFLGPDGVEVIREGERLSFVGSGEQARRYLEEEITLLYEIDGRSSGAAIAEANRAVSGAEKGQRHEIALDPEPIFWAEISPVGEK